jgi:hypothetical protein
MKTNYKFLALALVLCGISAGANAQTFSYHDGIYYTVTSTSPNEVKVANNGSYSVSTVVIPASVVYNSNTYAVTAIGYEAFALCSKLASVTIPNSVETIGEKAFYDCSKLTSVTIPNSVETIGAYAFHGCSGLTSVTIGNSVKTIGAYAFRGCSSLTSVTICNSVETIGYYAFEGCSGLTTLNYNAVNCTLERYWLSGSTSSLSSLSTLNIGNDVQTIPAYAFYNCSKLTSVTIGNSVKTIGAYAFRGCSGLTGTLTIPNSVETIGNAAFDGCIKLTSVTIGNSVETIGNAAFADCSGLETVYVKAITPPAAGEDAFYGVPAGIPVHVPCGTVAAYQSAAQWSAFTNYIDDLPLLNLTVQSEDINKGTASVTQTNTCTNNTAVIEAAPIAGYQFAQWSDGNMDNPRTLAVTQDTVLTAIFGIISGIEGTQATALALYPNPVRDELFISGVSGDAKIVITDLSGRTVVGVKNFSPSQNDNLSINVSHLAKGVYLIKVNNVTGKIVKE